MICRLLYLSFITRTGSVDCCTYLGLAVVLLTFEFCEFNSNLLFILGFSRLGSFRQATLTERLADPQSTKVVEPITSGTGSPSSARPNVDTAQVERPHASANLLLRQGSFNTFNKLNR